MKTACTPSTSLTESQYFDQMVCRTVNALANDLDVDLIMAANSRKDALHYLGWNKRSVALGAFCDLMEEDDANIPAGNLLAVKHGDRLELIVTVRALEELYPQEEVS